jgi:hypothetical protein
VKRTNDKYNDRGHALYFGSTNHLCLRAFSFRHSSLSALHTPWPPPRPTPKMPDHAKPLGAPRWTEVVKAVLKRQAGVPFAPKDLRSSFITFLLSDSNTDEALKKAVAHAMRHSPAQQGSAAYDKDRAERTWAAAVQVAGAFAARFA